MVKEVTDFKEMFEMIGDWETDEIDVYYEKYAEKVRLEYENQEVIYYGTVKEVARIAYHCGGISSKAFFEIDSKV